MKVIRFTENSNIQTCISITYHATNPEYQFTTFHTLINREYKLPLNKKAMCNGYEVNRNIKNKVKIIRNTYFQIR